MEAIILYAGTGKIAELAEGLAEGLGERHQVKIFSGEEAPENINLRNYDYLFLGSELKGLFRKKAPAAARRLIHNCKGMLGQEAVAFIPSQLIGEARGLRNLMNEMEKEGTFVRDFRSFQTRQEALDYGRSVK